MPAYDVYFNISALVKLYMREPETSEVSAFVRKYAHPALHLAA